MDAHKALITNIFNNSTLVEVPFFQRSYVWREDLWGRLLEDMEFVVKTKKPHFLEHLMPKKWRNNWGACATEDDAKKRDSLLLTLGNLAIIPQALNASIRDAAWNVKKAGKGQNKPGLLLCASGLYTLHDVLQKNDWNEHEIENRAEWLLANAQNIWKI